MRLRLRLRLEEGGVGSGITTLAQVLPHWLRLRLRLRLEGEGSWLSCNHTRLQSLKAFKVQCIIAKIIVPPPRPLLYKRYKMTKNELKGRKAM